MWFIFAIITLLSWGTADLFYKMGTDPKDKYSHLKIVIMVGLVMGIHAVSYILYNGISYNPINMIKYLPVSSMYIISMTIGYVGLRYLELSIVSPLSNSSGAVAAILTFLFLGQTMGRLQFFAVTIITLGIILLAKLEGKDETLVEENKDKKYSISAIAIIFPILYAIIDGVGTFLDGFYLDRILTEADANISYELTFLLVGIIAFIYIRFIKKEKIFFKEEKTKLFAAGFETFGQFFYVYAMAENSIVTAPLIASYSIVSIILSRIFLKEKLTKMQYAVIGAIMIGIFILGIE
ncbi:EamA family transporter [Tissierella creatinophila]|uniref:EamA-like transporter family protein n=1 Tax=Tissierella creatinophila DSM 6911 TaxID=1123403 RepID=A0A1U7M949_TISCR|nr:EamA family transporter [Tissierella creatinophila]OLS03801.1 EamA-like transporter family protein [Tissierella creatinophila DSM 6911]